MKKIIVSIIIVITLMIIGLIAFYSTSDYSNDIGTNTDNFVEENNSIIENSNGTYSSTTENISDDSGVSNNTLSESQREYDMPAPGETTVDVSESKEKEKMYAQLKENYNIEKCKSVAIDAIYTCRSFNSNSLQDATWTSAVQSKIDSNLAEQTDKDVNLLYTASLPVWRSNMSSYTSGISNEILSVESAGVYSTKVGSAYYPAVRVTVTERTNSVLPYPYGDAWKSLNEIRRDYVVYLNPSQEKAFYVGQLGEDEILGYDVNHFITTEHIKTPAEEKEWQEYMNKYGGH